MTKEENIKSLEALQIEGIETLSAESVEKIAALHGASEEAKTQLKTQESLIAKLNKAVEAADKATPEKITTFKVGKESYELVVPHSTYRKQIVNAATLKADKDLLEELVKIGAGILKKVEK